MKKLLSLVMLLFITMASQTSFATERALSNNAEAVFQSRTKTVHVRSYTRKNGTHVNSYMRSRPHKRR